MTEIGFPVIGGKNIFNMALYKTCHVLGLESNIETEGLFVMKKLLLIVVDALASRVLIPAIQSGRLPNISALAKAGSLSTECSSIFPSITPAATSSLVTGCYPRDHGIPGAFWYDDEKGDVAYYGSDIWVILNEGINRFFEDFLVHLNQQKLKVETLFQAVERAGLHAGCLNYIVFHGDVLHRVDVPLVLDIMPGVPSKADVYGPSLLYLGDFVGKALQTDGKVVHQFGFQKAAKVLSERAHGGMFNRFGMEDDYTARILIGLAKKRALPDLTVAYFPDNDFRSHEVGPHAAVTVLESFDAKLGELFAAYGGLERMLQELCVVITGDHSQSDVQPDEEEVGIRLDELLKDFHLVDPGALWDSDDELMICPNMGAAQIYFRDPKPGSIKRVIRLLLNDPRIDQIIWRAEFTEGNVPGYRIVTHRRGSLHFWVGAEGPNTAVDEQGCRWSWNGNLETVDGHLSDEDVLFFPGYPNAFERIAGGLDCEDGGHLWVTSKPGSEFRLRSTSVHTGSGSHGSLHALDSVVPLLVAGAPADIELPPHPRTVDVTPLCLAVLGLRSRYSLGESHIKERR